MKNLHSSTEIYHDRTKECITWKAHPTHFSRVFFIAPSRTEKVGFESTPSGMKSVTAYKYQHQPVKATS